MKLKNHQISSSNLKNIFQIFLKRMNKLDFCTTKLFVNYSASFQIVFCRYDTKKYFIHSHWLLKFDPPSDEKRDFLFESTDSDSVHME